MALALAGGVALFAGHAPLGQGWMGLFALVPLSLLARDLAGDAHPARAGLRWGMVAGAAFFGPLLWWIHNINEYAAWPLLTAALAPFVAVWVAGLAWWGERPARAVLAVAGWVALEALRTVFPFGGFPWGVLGYTQAADGPLLQAARTVGVLGVSALLAGVAVCVEAAVVAGVRAWRGAPRRSDDDLAVLPGGEQIARATRVPLAAGVAVLVAAVLLGGSPPPPTGQTVDVAAIQGFNLEGSTGRDFDRSMAIARRQADVTEQVALEGPPELAVWPENALDHDVSGDANPELRAELDRALAALDGAPLVTGMIEELPDRRFRNSVVGFDGDGDRLGRYDKRQFVPFGEYIPFRGLIEWLPPLQRVPRDGVAGEGPSVIDAAGATIGPVICFEVVWPSLVREQVAEGADLLVVATNNSSFGRSPASDQHIAFSQLRAVETGRWVVHAALSGRSALVDPRGGVHQRTGLYEQDVVRADVPLVTETTPAMAVGDAPAWAAAAVALMLLGWGWRARRRPTASPKAGQ